MKLRTIGAALLAAGAAQSALAGEGAVVEPGLRFAWSFGATQTASRPTLSLGLYPNDLGWRRLWADAGVEEISRVNRPAVLDLHVGADSGPRLMGLPLTAQALGLNADGQDASGARFLRPALIVLAAGAAAALVIGAAGDAAEDNNPTPPPEPNACPVIGSGNIGPVESPGVESPSC